MLDLPYIHSIALGMQSVDEVIMNTCIFNNEKAPVTKMSLQKKQRHLHIDWWCTGCSKCVKKGANKEHFI